MFFTKITIFRDSWDFFSVYCIMTVEIKARQCNWWCRTGSESHYVFNNALNVEVDDGLPSLSGFEELEALPVVVEAVFGEDCGAEGVAEEVEVFFVVGVAIGGSVRSFICVKFFGCGLCKLFGEGIGLGLAFGGVDAPA